MFPYTIVGANLMYKCRQRRQCRSYRENSESDFLDVSNPTQYLA
eukprot:UN17028